MNSPFKFPRRVRIHGGECGAVARALHHEAQKDALMSYEQPLVRRVDLRQADSGKALGSTFIERKQMSTKTTLKRIALVAVSAMGFGLLSIVPASAGPVDATSIASATMAPVRAGDTKNVTVNLAFSTWASGDTVTANALVHARTLSAPASATAFDGSASGANSTVYESSGDLNAIATTGTASATAGAATIRMAVPVAVNPSAAGTYTILVWYDATGSATDGPTVTSPQTTVTFTVAGAPSTINLDSTAKSGSAGVTTGGTFGFTLKDAAGLPTYLKTGETLSGSVSDVSPNVSGGTLYVADGSTANLTGGNATTKSISVSAADGTGAITVATTSAGIARARIVGSGLLTGVVAAVTADYTTVAYIYATKLKLSTAAGVSNASASTGAPTVPAEIVGTGTGDIWASNSSAKSLSFLVTSGSAGTAQYSIAAIDSLTALPTGVTAGTYTVTTAGTSTFTASITVAATAATAGSGYKLSIGTGAGTNMVYTVVYQAPIVNSSNGYVVVSPTTANAAKTLRGGSATIAATVYDQFGDAFSGANVIWTITGRNTYTAASSSNASGQTSYTVVDASTSTTSLTDTIKVTAASPTATTYTVSTNNSASAETVLNYVTSVTVSSLTLTNNAVTAAAIAAGTAATAPDASVTLTATAKDAAGTVMSGIPVTFTLPAGAYVSAGTLLTVYTNSSGVATLAIKSTLTGTNTATATAGGATATSAYSIANVATDGRVLSIDKSTISVTEASAGQVVITVKDRYGNLVGGAQFGVAYVGTAGRVSAVNGVVASTGTTDATTGTATVDVTATSAEAGSGTLTITLTSGQFDNSTSTLMGNGSAYTTRVSSVTSAVTIAASTAKTAADAVAAAEAASAAATKAGTDAVAAANAATAAANAASKAAQDAAVAAAEKAAKDAVAAAKAAQDAAVAAAEKAAKDSVAAAKAAQDAAVAAAKAAQDAAVAAAEKAAKDAVAAAKAAQDAAVAESQAATDAAAEAIDAANAATDAANLAAEAADAATVAAEEARDAADAATAAIEELATQVATLMAALRAQITTLANTVAKIAKKVKA
jgi:hypothetical protein